MKTYFNLSNAQEEGPASGSEWFLTSNVINTFHAKFHAFTSWCTIFDIFCTYLLH